MSRSNRWVRAGALTLAVLSGGVALAKDADPSSLYEVTTKGSTERLKSGEAGTFVLQITAKEGAHVSDEAPLRLELHGNNVNVERTKLTLSDSVAKKAEGQKYRNPRFEVPVRAQKPGKASVDGKLIFFICTETLCARQQKTLSVPIEVL